MLNRYYNAGASAAFAKFAIDLAGLKALLPAAGRGALTSGAIGAGVGALYDSDDRLSGALKGGLTGAAIGGLGGAGLKHVANSGWLDDIGGMGSAALSKAKGRVKQPVKTQPDMVSTMYGMMPRHEFDAHNAAVRAQELAERAKMPPDMRAHFEEKERLSDARQFF